MLRKCGTSHNKVQFIQYLNHFKNQFSNIFRQKKYYCVNLTNVFFLRILIFLFIDRNYLTILSCRVANAATQHMKWCSHPTNDHELPNFDPQCLSQCNNAHQPTPWRMNDKWSGKGFLLGFSSLANHGDY